MIYASNTRETLPRLSSRPAPRAWKPARSSGRVGTCLRVAGCVLLAASVAHGTDPAGLETSRPLVAAHLRADRPIVQAGRPVWVEFYLSNQTDEAITLQSPQADSLASAYERDGQEAHNPSREMGLPINHVFGGLRGSPLTIRDEQGTRHEFSGMSRRFRESVPEIRVGPHGAVGRRVELTQYYDVLRRPGRYTLTWQPYQGEVQSPELSITILAERQAVIQTEFGRMVMRFHYDEAPRHVENFIELIREGLYRNLTFHRVIPGGLIQGGDPRGDGRGIRPDGKLLKAEFSKIPFELGTVGMARSPRDPDSASCQFFICLSRQPSFDENQTAFGYLVGDESFETLRKIAAVPTGANDRPLKPVYIHSISLENVPVRDREEPGREPVAGPPGRHLAPESVRSPRLAAPAADRTPGAPGGIFPYDRTDTTTRPADGQ